MDAMISPSDAQTSKSAGGRGLSTPPPARGLSAALHVARLCCPVLPLAQKRPLIKGGCNAASTDPDTIRGWWTEWPAAEVGLATGSASGIFVIDIDGSAGRASLLALEAKFGRFPPTLTVPTPRGVHHFFRTPDGADVRSRQSPDSLGTGIDARGTGGYVRLYDGFVEAFDTMPIADAPEWLVERLSDSQRAGRGGTSGEGVTSIPEGRRNATLTSQGGSMRARGMGERAILAGLLAANEDQCQPPLLESEVRRIARSVARYPATGNGSHAQDATFPDPLGLRDLLQVREPPDPFLVEGLVPSGSNVLVLGAPKSQKSILVTHLAISLAAGTDFLGAFGVPAPRRVGLVFMEDRPASVARRVRRICAAEGVEPGQLQGQLYVWPRPPLSLGNEASVRALARFAASLCLDVVALDPFAHIGVGDANDAGQVNSSAGTAVSPA
jgi:hypothetical protein